MFCHINYDGKRKPEKHSFKTDKSIKVNLKNCNAIDGMLSAYATAVSGTLFIHRQESIPNGFFAASQSHPLLCSSRKVNHFFHFNYELYLFCFKSFGCFVKCGNMLLVVLVLLQKQKDFFVFLYPIRFALMLFSSNR